MAAVEQDADDKRLRQWDAFRLRPCNGPFLQIAPDVVGPTRTRAALGYLEGLMLWPDDPTKQLEAADAAEAATFVELLPDQSLVSKEITAALWKAPRVRPFDAQTEKRIRVGAAIGKVLIDAIVQPDRTLEDLFLEAQAILTKQFGNHAPRQLQKNYWRKGKFRSVAHLWAATMCLKDWTLHVRFPCALVDLPEFLAAAEYFRWLAEQRHLSSQSSETTLLMPGDAFAVSSTVALPLPPIAISKRS